MRAVGFILAVSSCAVLSAYAQTTSCSDYAYPIRLRRTIRGQCGPRGDSGEGPERIRGTSGTDIIDGSPARRGPNCVGVHEKMRGRGGNDIFMVDFEMPVTGTDTDPDENDQRSWYPDVRDFGPGDTMVVYNVPDGGADMLAEIYNVDEDEDLLRKQSGQIYLMIGRANDTKKARMRFDCGQGYTIWAKRCPRNEGGSASGYCTAIFYDRQRDRVLAPLICVPRGSEVGEYPSGYSESECTRGF